MANEATETQIKKITDLEENVAAGDNDLMMVGNAGTSTLRKITWSNLLASIRDKIASWVFAEVKTTDKTILGAINEVYDSSTEAMEAANGEVSDRTVTYTETTENTPPASGSSLSLIAGWTVGKIKNILSKLTVIDQTITPFTKTNEIVKDDDLNDEKFTVKGDWTCDNMEKAASIKNIPNADSGFRLKVECIGVPWIVRQTLIYQNNKTYTFKRRVYQTDGAWKQDVWIGNDTDIDKLTDSVNQLNSEIAGIKTELLDTAEITVSSKQAGNAVLQNAYLQGYRLLFAVPYWSSISSVVPQGCSVSGNKVSVSVYNTSETSYKIYCKVQCLYIKV